MISALGRFTSEYKMTWGSGVWQKNEEKRPVRKLLRLFQVRGHGESNKSFVLPMKVHKEVGYARHGRY